MSAAEAETHIQILQTVPAEGVFAALTEHLRAALVPLDVDATHGALFDGHVGATVGAGPVFEETRHIRNVVSRSVVECEAKKTSRVSRPHVKSLFSNTLKG